MNIQNLPGKIVKVKLKLGDTFRVVINHNIRHLEQVKDVLNAQAKTDDLESLVI